MALNPELLALLACPVCRGELEPVENESGLECPPCSPKRHEAGYSRFRRSFFHAGRLHT